MYDKLFRQSGIDELYRKIRDIRICYHPIYGIKESVGYESGIFWSKNNGKQLFLKEKVKTPNMTVTATTLMIAARNTSRCPNTVGCP